jgi:hypothetical protein
VRGGGVTPELYQGMRRDSWAMNLVKGMGWKEGEGIGANGDGMTTHIHVKKRREVRRGEPSQWVAWSMQLQPAGGRLASRAPSGGVV